MFIATKPDLGNAAFVAGNATVIGNVILKKDARVWYQAVLRADIQRIVVGEGSNIQDGAIVHLSSDLGVSVGDYVTIGHRAIIHACEIEDEVLVGMGAIVMDGAVVGSRSIIGAGTLVTKDQKIPSGSLVLGSPGRVVRALSEQEQLDIRKTAEKYIHVSRFHRELA